MGQIAKLAPFVGVNKDLSAEDLPPGAFTEANNVRFRNGYAEVFRGQVDAYVPNPGPIPISPISAFPLSIVSAPYWIALSTTKAYLVTGSPGVWIDITRTTGGNYAATTDLCWNGGILNGVPVLNNGIDVPQSLSALSTSGKLQALPNWPANDRAKVMRVFKNVVWALGVTTGGTYYPHRLRFSQSADPGTLPTTYTAAAGNQAGEYDLEGASELVDAIPLRGSFIIYKQKSTHVATYVGGDFIWQFNLLFATSGMLAPDCGVEIEGAHVVLTSNDVILHDGQTQKSVLDKATRTWLFRNIDAAGQNLCFVVKNLAFNEVWVCFPSLGATSCDKALIYNYKDGTTSFRTLPNVSSGNTGLVDDSQASTYDAQTNSYDEDLRAYNENEFGATAERTLLCSPTRPSLVLVDSGTRFFGLPIQASMSRYGIDLGDPNRYKTIVRLRPRFSEMPPGISLQFQAGGHATLDGPITWAQPVTYTAGQTFTIDTFASGRFLAWQVISNATTWRLEGMDIEFAVRGGY